MKIGIGGGAAGPQEARKPRRPARLPKAYAVRGRQRGLAESLEAVL
jgi:hypothetical protein